MDALYDSPQILAHNGCILTQAKSRNQNIYAKFCPLFFSNLWHNSPMPLKTRWIWEGYLVLIIALAAGKAYNFFSPRSPQHLYFQILYYFHPLFFIPYFLTLAQILFNILHCLPLALYIYRIPLSQPQVWKCLFMLRVIFDLTGHPYEMNTLVSIYHADPPICLLTLLLAVFPSIPSYWACWRYAFRREKL